MTKEQDIKARIKIAQLFCQHCKAVQKVMNVKADCLYNPLIDGHEYAFCASNQDAVDSIFKVHLPVKHTVITESIPISSIIPFRKSTEGDTVYIMRVAQAACQAQVDKDNKEHK